MIRPTTNSRESQQARLESKTQEQQLVNRAVEGTGMSRWEAEILVEVVQEVYFSEPGRDQLQSGQLVYECVAESEGAGKPIRECQMLRVVLTLTAKSDAELVTQYGIAALRQARLVRLTEEAREQGGVLTQEDLALLLGSDVRTIRRDIKALRDEKGIRVATRGQVKDIGPGVTHKEIALQLWLEGREPVEIARRLKHSLHAVERYIHHFSRVVFLHRKGFPLLQIALTVGISSALTQIYLDLYEPSKRKRAYQPRFREMECIGLQHYQAEDEKKGGHLRGGSTKRNGRRP